MWISSAYAQAQGGQASGDVFSLVMMLGLFAVMWFILIRPQRKRQKEHEALVAALGKGDEVITASGILGKIVGLNDNYVTVNVAPNVELKFQRMHIHAVLPKGTLKTVSAD